jgi:hypothetical protein
MKNREDLTRKGVLDVLQFYDPIDKADQKRVEEVLRRGGIEYFLKEEPKPGLDSSQILVAEEDVARAENLLARKS